MGNTIFIKDRRVCVRLIRNRLEAIQKLNLPTAVKGCRSCAGMVKNFEFILSRITEILKIYIKCD